MTTPKDTDPKEVRVLLLKARQRTMAETLASLGVNIEQDRLLTARPSGWSQREWARYVAAVYPATTHDGD